MRILIYFLIQIICFYTFSQSKKEQIEILTHRVDSLNNVLKTDRNLNNQKELEYKEQISSLQKQLENLNGTLTKTKEELSKKDVELKNSNQELINKTMELKALKNQIYEKEERIKILSNQVQKLKTTTNFNLELQKFKVEEIFAFNGAISWQITLIINEKLIDTFYPAWDIEPIDKEGSKIEVISDEWNRQYSLINLTDQQIKVILTFHDIDLKEDKIEMESVYIKNDKGEWIKQSCSGLCSD